MTSSPKFLDLDATDPNTPEVVIKLKGIEHKLVPLTLDGFIANTKAMNRLSTKATMEDEMDLICEMLIRSFPTMTREMLGSIELAKLNALMDFANAHNGQDKVSGEADAEVAEGNAAPAAA